MKRTIFLAVLLCVLTILSTCPQASAETAESPTWQPWNKWLFNMTIEGNTNYHRVLIYTHAWGEYDDEGTTINTFVTHYITNTLLDSNEYGDIRIRADETRHITRLDYKTAFSEEMKTINYERNHEDRTIKTKTKYDTFIDPYSFPLNVGDKWDNTVKMNITTTIWEGANLTKLSDENKISETVHTETREFYYNCDDMVEVDITLADNDKYYYLNQTTTWTEITFNTFRIVQDDEVSDTDGNYIVEYYNASVGNIVKRETFTDGDLNTTALLAFYKYKKTDEPWDPPDRPPEGGSEFCLCVGAIAIILVLLFSFVTIRRRRFEEDRFSKEYIEDVDTKTELVELCEEADLSPKGSKSELRKRLLAYAEEMEEEGEGDSEDEDEEDEFDLGKDEEESPEDIEDEEGLVDEEEIEEIGDDEDKT